MLFDLAQLARLWRALDRVACIFVRGAIGAPAISRHGLDAVIKKAGIVASSTWCIGHTHRFLTATDCRNRLLHSSLSSLPKVLAVHGLQLELRADLLAREPPAVQRLLRRLCCCDRSELDVHKALRSSRKFDQLMTPKHGVAAGGQKTCVNRACMSMQTMLHMQATLALLHAAYPRETAAGPLSPCPRGGGTPCRTSHTPP